MALSALAGGLVWLLSPKGSVQKALQAVVAVFLLCAFLSPFLGRAGIALEWAAPEALETPVNPELERTLLEQQRQAVEEALRKQIWGLLAAREIEGAEIFVRTDILDNASIEIVAVQAVLPELPGGSGANIEALRAALREAVGIDVEVRVGQAKGG